MVDDEKYILLIDEIKRLYIDHVGVQENLCVEKEKKFSKFCDELHALYEVEKENIFNGYIKPFINEYSFIEDTSSLQVINKLHYETYHSLFLKYILDSQNSFGHEVLREFLSNVADNKNWFENLSLCTYNVHEEVSTKGLKNGNNKKRIDLLFVDDKNKWCIVIENKIDSEVHYHGDNKRSQLDFYYDYCERTYKDYEKLYILLSYNEKNSSHKRTGWEYADYYDVFKSLLKHHSKDALVNDYLKTVFKLLFPNETMNSYQRSSLYRGRKFYSNIIQKMK